jgi:SAM-dependent methyltransferase
VTDRRDIVRENYARRAETAAPETGARSTPCCGEETRAADAVAPAEGTVLDRAVTPSSSQAVGYTAEQLGAVPRGADMGLGCGTPLALAALQPGETVLDLGSGGGLDCFLAAPEVGPQGQVIGVDMTPEMVSRARAAAQEEGFSQVEFRLGEIEHLPVADGTIDAILSNCVINLSPDKQQVYDECFRVLRVGGRLALSDVVEVAPMSAAMREDAKLTSCCVGGARTPEEVRAMLEAAGFEEVEVDVKASSRDFIQGWVPGSRAEDYVASATIRAVKRDRQPETRPRRGGCCG